MLRRTLELAADPAGSKKELGRTIASTAGSLMELAEEWETHRAPLLGQIREAERARRARREGAADKMREVRNLRGEMQGLVTELQERDERQGRLAKEVERAAGGQPRASYTDRILDIVRNLRKQQIEIERILAEIRGAQKEVNSLSETLDRSFAAADEAIFRDAVKNAASKKCYKALAAMHAAFGSLVEHVQQIANASNARVDVEAKVGELGAKNTAEAIERISADLKALKAENAKLTAVPGAA